MFGLSEIREQGRAKMKRNKKDMYNIPGSQPMVALKPSMPHPGLFPVVISFNPAYPVLYSHGFKKPRGGLPALIRASLSMETMEEKVGEEQEVPEAYCMLPW